jgi:hypothetical protein
VLGVKLQLPFWGLGKLWPHEVAYGTGYGIRTTESALQHLASTNWLERANPWIWLRNGLRFEPSISLNNPKHLTSIRANLKDVPALPILAAFLAHYPELDDGSFGPFSPTVPGTLSDTVPDTLHRTQSRNRNRKQEQEITTQVGVFDDETGSKIEPGGPDTARCLFAAWEAVLGGAHPHTLTTRRRKVLLSLWKEQLRKLEQPMATFQALLKSVKMSEYHMGTRAYQMPESLFRNPERRERWVDIAVNGTGLEGLAAADRKALQRRANLSNLDLGGQEQRKQP